MPRKAAPQPAADLRAGGESRTFRIIAALLVKSAEAVPRMFAGIHGVIYGVMLLLGGAGLARRGFFGFFLRVTL